MIGFAPVAMSMKNGERESTYTAFVKPFRNTRHRLTVLTYSEVEQVIDILFLTPTYKKSDLPILFIYTFVPFFVLMKTIFFIFPF